MWRASFERLAEKIPVIFLEVLLFGNLKSWA
jgi:hypothetical protein